MDGAAITAAAATALSAWQLVPQVTKTRRVASTVGLSPAWAVFGVILNVGWVAYRWSRELWPALVSPVAGLVLYLVLVVLIVRSGRAMWWALAGAGVMGASLGVGAAIGGWVAFGLCLGAWSAVQVGPSVWTAFRTADLSAVARGMWLIGLAQAAAWGHYGLVTGDLALVVYGGVTGSGSAIILARCSYTQRRRWPRNDLAHDQGLLRRHTVE